MKNIIILLTCFLIIFIFSGCNKTKTSFRVENPSSEVKNISSEIDDATVEIEIYKVSRDTFYSFLENPSMDLLNSNKSKRCVYSKGDQWHVRHGAVRFILQDSFFDFVGNQVEIKKFLTENGISDNFQNTVIIDAPNLPLTMWISTTEKNIYITIERDNDKDYIYKYYTLSDYLDKYGVVSASLNINGLDIKNMNLSKIYSDYADLPFVTVLKFLGATLTQQSDSSIEINFNGRFYVLNIDNIELYEIGKEKLNILNKDGGNMFAYPEGDELMIDSFTLKTILNMMGKSINVTCDKTNKIVLIRTQG